MNKQSQVEHDAAWALARACCYAPDDTDIEEALKRIRRLSAAGFTICGPTELPMPALPLRSLLDVARAFDERNGTSHGAGAYSAMCDAYQSERSGEAGLAIATH